MNLTCTQCGGELQYREGEKFVSCSFCDASLYVDRSRVVFHYYVKPTLDMPGAHKNLRRWMAGNETVEGLERESKTVRQEFYYFPLWFFKINRAGEEEIIMEPAVSTSITEIRFIEIPAGMMEFYEPSEVENPGEFQQVEVTYDSALQWLSDREINPAFISGVSLVHVPVFRFAYQYKEYEYTAVVEAATGRVIANVFPAKQELPFTLITLGAAFIFLMEGLLCPTLLLRFFVMLLTAVPLGYLADYIIRKY